LAHSVFTKDHLPQLAYAGSLDMAAGEPFLNSLHNNPEVTELMLICEGEGTFLFDGKEYWAGDKTILFYNQGLWHEERSLHHRPFKTLYLGFSNMQLSGLPTGFFIDRQLPPVIPLKEHYFHIEQRLKEIVKEKNSPSPESDMVANHLLGALLAELARCLLHRKPKADTRKGMAASQAGAIVKRYIHENYTMELSLKHLAGLVFVSPFHLCRIYKQETGMTPIQYIIHYRIEVSKQHLSSSDETIGTIAKKVGYDSETYFQNIFKKITGLTPGQYRATT
jgi:AraC-like DNA-binding protein